MLNQKRQIMKKLNFLTPVMAISVLSFVLFFSCTKDNDSVSLSDADVEIAEDDAIIDEIYEEVDATVESEVYDLDKNGYQSVSLKSVTEDVCRTVTVDHPDSTYFPKIITIDYGDGCSTVINGDTIIKSGKIIVEVTDRWFVPGAQRIVTFEDYYVNNMKIEGTRTITNEGLNDELNLQFHIVLEDGKITVNDTLFYTRESDRTRIWVITDNPLTDTVFVTGTMEGINFSGLEYSREIIEPLTIIRCSEYSYRWKIVSGEILCIVGEEEWILDFGDGTCDRTTQITRTRDGATKELGLTNRRRHLRRLSQPGL